MRTYSSTEWNTLPNVILTSYTDWYPSDTDYTKTKDDAYFGTVFYPSKLESHGPFDMYGDYADKTIAQDSDCCLFDVNTYDEYYDFTIYIYACHEATLQDN